MILLEIIILCYFLYVVSYTFLFSMAGLFYAAPGTKASATHAFITILIPAYREDAVIVETARKVLLQAYPTEKYKVIIIADGLEVETLNQLSKLQLTSLPVVFQESTKVKALKAGLHQVGKQSDLVLILDADNVMEEDFLAKINQAYQAGHKVIQAKRIAKNKNTRFAVLDGLSEILNNHIYRAGSNGLGMSSSLIGSGMAFEANLLKEILKDMDAVGGFDREMEVLFLLKGHKARYISNALVYDEKVAGANVFANQRKRWIASQYFYLRKYWGVGMKAFFSGKWALFNSTIWRNIQLPRVINLGLLGLIAVGSTLLHSFLSLSPWVWWGLLGILLLSMILAVPLSFYNRSFFKSLLSLPRAFWIMFTLLFRLKGANKRFIHTPHGQKPMK